MVAWVKYTISLGVEVKRMGLVLWGFPLYPVQSQTKEKIVLSLKSWLTLVRGRDTDHGPGVQSVSREEIRLEFILALTDALIQSKTISFFRTFPF